jgi:hypothetical protein
MTRLSTDPVRQQWESEEATFEWKRALLNATIRKIVVHPQRVKVFDPDLIEVTWAA